MIEKISDTPRRVGELRVTCIASLLGAVVAVLSSYFLEILSTFLFDREDEFGHGALPELQLSTWEPTITARMPHVQ